MRFDRKHTVASKTPRVFAENASRRTKRPAFWQKTRRAEENAPRFDKKHAVAGKTFSGGAHFRIGEAPPERVFVKITPGREKPFQVLPDFAPGRAKLICHGDFLDA